MALAALARALAAYTAAQQACASPLGDALSLLQLAEPAAANGSAYHGPPLIPDNSTAEVSLVTGKLNGTWLPCTVLRSKTRKNDAFYDIHAVGGTEGQYWVKLNGITGKLLRQTSPETFAAASEKLMENVQAAKDALLQLEKEDLGRRKTEMLLRGMTHLQAKEKMNYLQSNLMLKRDEESMALGCPAGYDTHRGDVEGPDQLRNGTRSKRDTAFLCGQDCNGIEECASFEWDVKTKYCNLNKEANPNQLGHNRLLFCRRQKPGQPPFDRAEFQRTALHAQKLSAAKKAAAFKRWQQRQQAALNAPSANSTATDAKA